MPADCPWPSRRLAEVAQIQTGAAKGKTTSADGVELPYLRVANVQDGYVDLREIKTILVEPKQVERYSLRSGDVLFTEGGDADKLGRGCVWQGQIEPCLHQNHIFAVRTDRTCLLPEFLSLYAASASGRSYFLECAKQTTNLASVNSSQLKDFPVAIPPLGEQRKITTILSSVDDAIQTTQAVIDQLGVVKKALMAELLTRGIPGRHTKFKQTEIGEVPEGWRCAILDAVAKRGSGHTPSKNHPEYWDGDVKWVSLKDSSSLDRLYISDTASHITPLGIAHSSAVEHPPGTVVLSRDAGVGKSAIMTDTMAVSQHFMAWICGPELDNHFLYYILQFRKPDFERIAIGNTIKTIGLPYFKALKVPLPTLAEQKLISATLTAIDRRIFCEQEYMERVSDVKSGIMSALLTGDLRVPPAETPA